MKVYHWVKIQTQTSQLRGECAYIEGIRGKRNNWLFVLFQASDGQWYKKDDSVVTTITEESVLKAKAYVLFL